MFQREPNTIRLLHTEQEAKACQEDLHKYLAEFFRRW